MPFRRSIAFLCLPIVLLAAACGGDDDSLQEAADNNTGAAATSTPAASATPGTSVTQPTGAPQASTDSAESACGLLTLEELSTAVDSSFADPGRAFVTPRTSGAATVVAEYLSSSGLDVNVDADLVGSQADLCQWVSQDRLQVVDIMIMSAAAYDAAFAAFQDANGFEEVSGLGDRAYKLNDHAQAVLGDLSVLVTFSTSEDPGANVALELLRKALTRM